MAILKPGKAPDNPALYRPISLTSYVGKLIEWMLQARVQILLESMDKIAPEQAGFHTGRSTEEHITRLSHDLMDTLEQLKTARTVLVTCRPERSL